MEYFDLYNLEPDEIEFLVSRSAIDISFRNNLRNDAERLKFNLVSLLNSFPESRNGKKEELKYTIDNLKFLINKISDHGQC